MILPADSVAFRRHQGDELGAAPRVAHALVYGIGQPQLPTLTLQRNVILRAIHAAGMVLLIRLEHRQPQLTAYLIVAAHQVLQLLLCHVEFLACLEVDGVDDTVRVDMVTVYMVQTNTSQPEKYPASRRAASCACRGSICSPLGKLCTMW